MKKFGIKIPTKIFIIFFKILKCKNNNYEFGKKIYYYKDL